MGTQLNINIARIAHLSLESILESMGPGDDVHSYWHEGHPFPSSDVCELGLWLKQRQAAMLVSSARYDALYKLVPVHEQFHQTAQKILKQLSGPASAVQQETLAADKEQMRTLSHEIIFLLTSAELAFLDAQWHKRAWFSHPLQSLSQRLFEEKFLPLSGDDGLLLDVS